MSTRGLVAVFANGEYRFAAYNRSDSYPSSCGLEVLKLIKAFPGSLDDMKNVLTRCQMVDAEADHRWAARHLEEALSGKKTEFEGDLYFAADSLFCEWCYVLDLDKQTLEVFGGMHEGEVKHGRFASKAFPAQTKVAGTDRYYGPVQELITFSLAKLPTDEVFVQKCNKAKDLFYERAEAEEMAGEL